MLNVPENTDRILLMPPNTSKVVKSKAIRPKAKEMVHRDQRLPILIVTR